MTEHAHQTDAEKEEKAKQDKEKKRAGQRDAVRKLVDDAAKAHLDLEREFVKEDQEEAKKKQDEAQKKAEKK